jgi:hypothetical protein
MEQLWLITVPNNKQQPSTAFKTIKSGVPDCQLFRFEIPNLVSELIFDYPPEIWDHFF